MHRYIDVIDYTFFEVGKRYQFQTKKNDSSDKKKRNDSNIEEEEGVIVEITERTEPCGNLCKLNYPTSTMKVWTQEHDLRNVND
mmetsp:Transcript_909/g.1043  ORF Transcript_909/g.1043 Transcript_909/m.1043 type:complete len:84 (-) Transcript_909:24-275(-)